MSDKAYNMPTVATTAKSEMEEIISAHATLDVRMVSAIAGDRLLSAREEAIIDRLKAERGEGFYCDVIYALTNKAFPPRQSKQLWNDIKAHRQALTMKLNRDPGVAVAAHDFLANKSTLMRHVTMVEESKMAALTTTATHDGLTKLYDQTTFKHKLKEELERQVRYGGTLSLVMLDIDHFKQVNDTLGHAEGDTVLRMLADILRLSVRSMDMAARYGGEEFAIILPQSDLQQAWVFAERLRLKVAEEFVKNGYQITISLGIAENNPEKPFHTAELIKAADAKLYQAKNAGRNQVCK